MVDQPTPQQPTPPQQPKPPQKTKFPQFPQQRMETQEEIRREAANESLFLIRRNLRQLIGFFLVLIVGGIIYYVANKPREPRTAGSWKSTLGGAISAKDAAGDALDKTADDTGPGTSDLEFDGSNSDESQAADSEPGSGSSVSEPEQTKAAPDIIDTGSPNELVEELFNLRFKKTGSLPVNFMTGQRRLKIARRMLEMEISDTQKIFAINDLIEVSLQQDALNMSGNLESRGVRENLIAVRDAYCNHENAAIGAKASLGFPLIPLHNYFVSKEESELDVAADQFDLHYEKLVRHPETIARYVKLVCDLYVESDFSPPHRELAARIMKRLKGSENEGIQNVARLIQEQIYFASSDLISLVERIEGGNSMARNHVQALFEGLDANPSTRTEIYAIAVNVIGEYSKLGKDEDAAALKKWLVTINGKNESEEDRKEVEKMIADLENGDPKDADQKDADLQEAK